MQSAVLTADSAPAASGGAGVATGGARLAA